MANFFQCCKIQSKEGDMKVKYKNRCGICYFGKPMGEWQGTPMCEECLSHRIVVTDEMRNRKQGTTPDRIDIPVMKSQGEWEWWQKQTREAVFNALDAANERLNQLVWKEKRLKRALWLMTAEWAESMGLASCNIAIKLSLKECFFYHDEANREKDIKKYKHRQVVFYKYADYCRAKAEQYMEEYK